LVKVQHQVPHVAIPTNSAGLPKLVSIRVSPVPKSALLELRATGPTDAYTRAFLDATMDEFLAYKKELRGAVAGDTYSSLSAQITKQETELRIAQQRLTAYMTNNNVAVLEEQAKAASVYLTQLLADCSRLKLEYELLEAMSSDAQVALATGTNPLAVAAVPAALTADGGAVPADQPAGLLSAKHELEKVKIMRARLNNYLLPRHPKIVKLDEQITQGEKLVEYFAQQSREQLSNTKQTLKLKIDELQRAIAEWEGKIKNASERIAECQRLKLEVDRVQGLHERLMALLQTVDVTQSIDQENLTILGRASATKLSKVPVPSVIAIVILLGLGAGLLLLFVLERTDDRLMSLDDVSGRFNEWIVGQVPELKHQSKERRRLLLESGDTRHMFAESFRNIRSALFFANFHQQNPRTLLVTSAIPNEGKSTFAANLARTIAFSGARVLLVDCDLRRGVQHQLFDVPREPGLAELLTNGATLRQFVVPTSVPNLTLLPCGNAGERCSELLLGEKCDRLLAQMRAEYDCVVVDSIPIFAADDTTSLAPKMDGVLFVIRGSYTGTRTARRALELLYERQAKVLGLVFNRADASARSYEYYKYTKYYGSQQS
jgi:capsular exopolysaccharide synthesis family protein